MKILHTADWHIGKKLENFSRIEEQKAVLNEIAQIADDEKVDAIIIAGDLFDTFSPSTEAIEIFYKALKTLTNKGNRPVIAISGNHDSPDRIETADPLARECGIFFIGYPNTHFKTLELETGLAVTKSIPGFMEIAIPTSNTPLRIVTTPYANEHRLKTMLNTEDKEEDLRMVLQDLWETIAKEHCDKNGVNILTTHLFVIKKGTTISEEPDDEKPILHVGGAQAIYTENFPDEIQYVALGHLHRKQEISSEKQPVVYSGSPISYSFAESNQKKYVAIVDVNPNEKAHINYIELSSGKKLLRLKANGITEAEELLKVHENDLLELTIETETYLTAKERRHLNQIHQGIVTLIPQVKNNNSSAESTKQTIDINKNMKELFIDYFKHTKGIEPNDELMKLFNEVISE
ncbi:metallophosphoesterase family protein [Plebeiibacterium sediminum]|uniref:Nuclease SbcCD subunit D n=1 Tax=Plebeiibacterium sediminum TaxID=2992112 RepID=A0AAE3M2C0_9BACT|nr:exonuclease subunit SbcD [Plebeiobacterium sediminum]MCW3785469.1 exonuclease subunit SbcD [Plebeiobacterium sediminum]